MKKYKIVDLSMIDDDYELEEDWYFNEDDEPTYDFKNVYEFVDSLRYNIEVALENGGYKYIDMTWAIAMTNLFEGGWFNINGFRYEVED